MQLDLFKALQSIHIEDDKATDVVQSLEGYVAMKIAEANAPLLAKLDGLNSRIDGVNAQISSVKWLVSAVGILIAIIGLAPAFDKIFLH